MTRKQFAAVLTTISMILTLVAQTFAVDLIEEPIFSVGLSRK